MTIDATAYCNFLRRRFRGNNFSACWRTISKYAYALPSENVFCRLHKYVRPLGPRTMGGRGSPFNDVCHQAIFAEEYENGENCHTIDVCAYTYLKYDIRPSLGRNVYYFHTRIDGYLLYYT